jgi:hypothetical protein
MKYSNPVASDLHLLRSELFFMITGIIREDIPIKREEVKRVKSIT